MYFFRPSKVRAAGVETYYMGPTKSVLMHDGYAVMYSMYATAYVEKC